MILMGIGALTVAGTCYKACITDYINPIDISTSAICNQPKYKNIRNFLEELTLSDENGKPYYLRCVGNKLEVRADQPATPVQINIKVKRNDWEKFKDE